MDDDASSIEQRLLALEKAIAQMQTYSAKTILMMPVTVVDQEGNVFVTIDKSQHDVSIKFMNRYGYCVASLGIEGTDTGYLALRNKEGQLVAYMDVEQAGARLILQNHQGKGGVVLFGGDSGDDLGGGINIYSTKNEAHLELWANNQGGSIRFYDDEYEEPFLAIPSQQNPERS